jgi:serralysin
MPELTLSALRACVDRRLPPEVAAEAADYAIRTNPANLPRGLDPREADPKTLAIQVGKKWQLPKDGSRLVLRVRFLDNVSDTIHQKVIAQVRQLEEWAHVRFDFVTSGTAEIRVGFDYTDGSWSNIGIDALFVPQDQRTMNFGWLYATTSTADYSSVVKHEFMHALGAIHEHQSPGAVIHWDRAKVYAAYGAPPNSWDKETIDDNVLSTYGPEGMSYTAFDPHSIMLYPVDPALTTDSFGSGWNTDLSQTDREFLLSHYPHPAAPPQPGPVTPGPSGPTPPAPEPPAPTSYPPLVVGAPPIYTEAVPSGSKVYRLKIQTAARYFVGVTRITGVGGLFVELHKGSYPSTLRQVRPGAVTAALQPGDYYVIVRPVDVVRGVGRFALAARRVGR